MHAYSQHDIAVQHARKKVRLLTTRSARGEIAHYLAMAADMRKCAQIFDRVYCLNTARYFVRIVKQRRLDRIRNA